MNATVTWQNGVAFEGNADTGHPVMMDGSPEFGGENRGSRPMELILMGLGGCASFDIVTILKKARQDITEVRCDLKAERADSIPAVFTKITLHFVVTGRNLKPAQVEKALRMSADTYCSASRMLKNGGVELDYSYEIKDAV